MPPRVARPALVRFWAPLRFRRRCERPTRQALLRCADRVQERVNGAARPCVSSRRGLQPSSWWSADPGESGTSTSDSGGCKLRICEQVIETVDGCPEEVGFGRRRRFDGRHIHCSEGGIEKGNQCFCVRATVTRRRKPFVLNELGEPDCSTEWRPVSAYIDANDPDPTPVGEQIVVRRRTGSERTTVLCDICSPHEFRIEVEADGVHTFAK